MSVQTRTRGTVVVDEVVLNVEEVWFADGLMFVRASTWGPQPDHAGGETDIRFFGADGSDCGSVRSVVPAWSSIDRHQRLHIELPIRFVEMTGASG